MRAIATDELFAVDFLCWVFVNHDVLYFFEAGLDGIMRGFSNFMGLYKLELSIDGDLGIDIHTIAELARAQRIDAHHARNLLDAIPDFALEFVVARRVGHIV